MYVVKFTYYLIVVEYFLVNLVQAIVCRSCSSNISKFRLFFSSLSNNNYNIKPRNDFWRSIRIFSSYLDEPQSPNLPYDPCPIFV